MQDEMAQLVPDHELTGPLQGALLDSSGLIGDHFLPCLVGSASLEPSSFHLPARGEAGKAAQKVLAALVRMTRWPNGGIRTENFHNLRETRAPAILIEQGFITNPAQEKQGRILCCYRLSFLIASRYASGKASLSGSKTGSASMSVLASGCLSIVAAMYFVASSNSPLIA